MGWACLGLELHLGCGHHSHGRDWQAEGQWREIPGMERNEYIHIILFKS